ncbi:MAG: cytochrome C oxidase subunit IV family protein [Nitrospirae bacterium]|nr:cytochrome C oxidase subunit IV family protein [Nitrospirota bacterium]
MNINNNNNIGYKTYLAVWCCLMILTAATVMAAGMGFGRYGSLASVLIASAKAGLILLFFMHLKYETFVFKLMLLAAILTMAVIIGLTFFDVGFRDGGR